MLSDRIQELKKMLMKEAGLVEKMVALSMDGLFYNNTGFLAEVNNFENQVNQIEI